MPNEQEYYEGYYEEKKDDIAAKRKEKYENDSDYRQKVIDRSRKYREEQRQSRPRARIPKHAKSKRYETGDGGTIDLFSVGSFALGVGRSVQCINHWEREGILPRTPYRQKQGSEENPRWFRYYTREMAAAVRKVVGEKGRLDPPIIPDKIRKKIVALWKKQGVPVGCEDGLAAALQETTH